MIDVTCQCGGIASVAEAQAGSSIRCSKCLKTLTFLCGETLPDGAGAGDFDARLTLQSGPARVGEQLYLGGVADIEIGKLPEKHLPLPGKLVSRNHCKLQRVDFGPSRWKLIDNKSTNGVFVNGGRVDERELQPGDIVTIGEYDFGFDLVAEPVMAAPPPPPPKPAGKTCPSCGKGYPAKASICTDCGINMDTGKPLVISKEFDENVLAGNVDTTVRAVSFFVPFGLFPIASEAFATKKPIATWVIFGITFITSVWFFIAMEGFTADNVSPATLNLMHWTGSLDKVAADFKAERLPDIDVEIAALEKEQRGSITVARRNQIKEELMELREERKKVDERPADVIAEELPWGPGVGFKPHQLLTHAFLHGGLMHFVGNMVFLLVFGLRVNELVGNLKFSILYPLLAIGSATIDHIVHLNDLPMPGLGASGAIMGLAGMYLFLFPLQRVHTVIWLRLGWRFPCWYKVFRMRGFWLLVLWIAFNDGLPMILKADDNVGHWSHVGGLICGVFFAVALLVSRLNTAYGGDLFSVVLGKRAWALIGKPRMA